MLEISTFQVGQLVGSRRTKFDGEEEENQLLGMGLKHMINAQRPEVLTGLSHAYGNITCPFVSLWNSK